MCDLFYYWCKLTHVFLLLQGAIYGMAQSIPDRSMVTEISQGFLDCLYSTEVAKSNNSHMNGNGKAH